jgi:dihydropteroate synthase
MHNRNETVYQDYIADVLADLEESLEIAKKAGIAVENIMLDPGIGFAKTYEQNLILLQQLEVLHSFGCPVLLGTSRKSVIGLTLNIPAKERVTGTVATTVMAVMKGCSFVRVHDIRENVEAIKMTEAILHAAV